jgi:hypothetical protein
MQAYVRARREAGRKGAATRSLGTREPLARAGKREGSGSAPARPVRLRSPCGHARKSAGAVSLEAAEIPERWLIGADARGVRTQRGQWWASGVSCRGEGKARRHAKFIVCCHRRCHGRRGRALA